MLLTECMDPLVLQEIASALYDIIDDIDTASDVFKTNDKMYRSFVEQIQRSKSLFLESNGYDLFLAGTMNDDENKDVPLE